MSFVCNVKRHGFSLAEVLVSLALLSLLTTTCLLVVIPSLRLTGRSSARSGLQQQGLMILTRLERNLLRSSDFGISLRQVTPGQPFLMSVQRLNSGQDAFGGAPAWENSLLLYRYAETTLVEDSYGAAQTGLPLSISSPLRCSEAQLLGLNQKSPEQHFVLTHLASKFAVTRQPSSLYTIDLTLEDPALASNGPARLHLSRSLAPRTP